ncbi:unnamed protein product [Scytosiphon promiscuus]
MSSQYEQGSPESSASGSLGGSSEMQLQELIVDFTDDGRILLEVKGVKGNECRVITEDLIKALGDVITTENTEEYFEEKVVNVQHVRRGRLQAATHLSSKEMTATIQQRSSRLTRMRTSSKSVDLSRS